MTDRERDALQIADLKYDDAGLIPAVIQQHDTGEVLMVAWMNSESLAKTLETRRTWFWSRSRSKYWMKGEESGNVQEVLDVRYDCDADCLLVAVDQVGSGVACHTGERSCFYRSLTDPDAGASAAPDGIGAVLGQHERVLRQRKADMPEGSYTA
ncbi:MAG: phosphoribosyl-AMP cyclohydrolase, partial [Actinobacteria bacterium]